MLKVSNSSEEHSFAERYHLELSNEPILPELIGTTEMLDVDIIQNVSFVCSERLFDCVFFCYLAHETLTGPC